MVFVPVFSSNFSFGFSRFSCFPLSRKYMDVFAGDLRFGVAPSASRLQDVLRSVLAKQNVPKAEHAPERSEERAQLVAAR